MLIYHPAYDAYHCVIRICAILKIVGRVEIDRLKILDFYLCFPTALSQATLPRNLAKIRTRLKPLSNPYRHPIGAKKVFLDVEKSLDPSLGCLEAAGLISINDNGFVVRTEKEIPQSLDLSCRRLIEEEHVFFADCLQPLCAMDLRGEGGLKDRSGLLEYRYDVA